MGVLILVQYVVVPGAIIFLVFWIVKIVKLVKLLKQTKREERGRTARPESKEMIKNARMTVIGMGIIALVLIVPLLVWWVDLLITTGN